MAFDTTDILLSILKIAIILGLWLNVTPIMVWIERRGSALIQDRPGPNRVGPFGLLQSFADALKFILKEDIIPAQAHKWLYTLAPTFGLLPALTPDLPQLLRDKVARGELGRKTGQGFHTWEETR